MKSTLRGFCAKQKERRDRVRCPQPTSEAEQVVAMSYEFEKMRVRQNLVFVNIDFTCRYMFYSFFCTIYRILWPARSLSLFN